MCDSLCCDSPSQNTREIVNNNDGTVFILENKSLWNWWGLLSRPNITVVSLQLPIKKGGNDFEVLVDDSQRFSYNFATNKAYWNGAFINPQITLNHEIKSYRVVINLSRNLYTISKIEK